MPRTPRAPEPPVALLQFVAQRHDADCGVACLAMFCGVRYEDVLVALDRQVIDTGMSVKEIRETAAKLKHPVRLRRGIDLHADSGILGIRFAGRRDEHVAILHDGKIYDTDGKVWDVQDYLESQHATPTSLLVRK